jgi:hypothetical protein
MGTERNGFFVHHDEGEDNDDVEAGAQSLSVPVQAITMSQPAATAINKKPAKLALLRGRVPVKVPN